MKKYSIISIVFTLSIILIAIFTYCKKEEFLSTPVEGGGKPPHGGSIIITEVTDLIGNSSEKIQYIELFNIYNKPISLQNWKLITEDDTTILDFTIPDSSFVIVASETTVERLKDPTIFPDLGIEEGKNLFTITSIAPLKEYSLLDRYNDIVDVYGGWDITNGRAVRDLETEEGDNKENISSWKLIPEIPAIDNKDTATKYTDPLAWKEPTFPPKEPINIIITEITDLDKYRTEQDNNDYLRFIELYNASKDTVNLNGWTLYKQNLKDDGKSLNNIVIPPESFYIISQNVISSITDIYPFLVEGTTVYRVNNIGAVKTAIITDETGTIVDIFGDVTISDGDIRGSAWDIFDGRAVRKLDVKQGTSNVSGNIDEWHIIPNLPNINDNPNMADPLDWKEPPAPKLNVFITEVTNLKTSGVDNLIYVELHNKDTEIANLTEWKLNVNSTDIDLSNISIGGEDFHILTANKTTLTGIYTDLTDEEKNKITENTNITGNTSISLKNEQGNTIDQYSSGENWDITNGKASRKTSVTEGNPTATEDEWTIAQNLDEVDDTNKDILADPLEWKEWTPPKEPANVIITEITDLIKEKDENDKNDYLRFIELYNASKDTEANLNGWTLHKQNLEDNSEKGSLNNIVIPPESFYIISQNVISTTIGFYPSLKEGTTISRVNNIGLRKTAIITDETGAVVDVFGNTDINNGELHDSDWDITDGRAVRKLDVKQGARSDKGDVQEWHIASNLPESVNNNPNIADPLEWKEWIPPEPPAPELNVFITEVTNLKTSGEDNLIYVELHNKDTEIANLTEWKLNVNSTDIDLSNISIGGEDFHILTANKTTLTGIYTDLTDEEKNKITENTNITGNTSISLKNEQGNTIDQYSSGENWDITNGKASRKTSVTEGNPTATEDEWTIAQNLDEVDDTNKDILADPLEWKEWTPPKEPANVIITEITDLLDENPTVDVGKTYIRYVELHNLSKDTEADLSAWKICKATLNAKFVLTDVVIPAGGFVLITVSHEKILHYYPNLDESSIYNISGSVGLKKTAVILDEQDNIIDIYGDLSLTGGGTAGDFRGSAWELTEGRAVRKTSVTKGISDSTGIIEEWIVQDSLEDIDGNTNIADPLEWK